MAIKKVKTGWQVDFRPEGRRGKRIRSTLPNKREAEAFVISEKAKAQTGNYKPPTKENRRLSDLAQEWFDVHGHNLKTGEERLAIIRALLLKMGDPYGDKASPDIFINYRRQAIEKCEISKNHANHLLGYLKAIYNELERVGRWSTAKPFEKIRHLEIDETEPVFLTKEEIIRLLNTADNWSRNTDLIHVISLCLATGFRWGEAANLKRERIQGNTIVLLNQDTKTGKGRTVVIENDLLKQITNGKPKRGPLFSVGRKSFDRALDQAGIVLPKGQKSHVLRHTFASYYMINGGCLLKLNKILGHATIQMTMRYAHLAPNHLEDMTARNPLSALGKGLRGHNVDTAPIETSEAA